MRSQKPIFNRKDQMSLLNFGMTYDQVEKHPNRHKNKEKMMSHMIFLTEQVMGVLLISKRCKRYQDYILCASKKSRDNCLSFMFDDLLSLILEWWKGPTKR